MGSLHNCKNLLILILALLFCATATAAFAAGSDQELQREKLVREKLLIEREKLLHRMLLLDREELRRKQVSSQPRPARIYAAPPLPLKNVSPVEPPVAALPPVQQYSQHPAPPPIIAAPVTAAAARSPALPQAKLGLNTLPGITVGIHGSKYGYHEEVGGAPFMNNKGYKIGVEATYTHELEDDWFIRGEGRYAYGTVDYAGSGSMSNNPDMTWEFRGLGGRDFIWNNFSLTPYAGLGVRRLYNDARGLSSTGASGYRRKSAYHYVPIGVVQRFALTEQARLATNLEYDFFIEGVQKSLLNDVAPGSGTLINKQRGGIGGIRGSVQVEAGNWAAGPGSTTGTSQSQMLTVPGSAGLNRIIKRPKSASKSPKDCSGSKNPNCSLQHF